MIQGFHRTRLSAMTANHSVLIAFSNLLIFTLPHQNKKGTSLGEVCVVLKFVTIQNETTSSDIEEIKVLLLGDNQMTSIGLAQTSGLWDLTELGLENNQISTLDADTIWNGLPPYRIKLHLEGNPFACNESMRWLDMEYQKLNVVWNNPPTCTSGENWFDAQICPDNKYYRGTRRGLTEVPDDIPDDVEEVFLSVNNITEIKANAFSNLASCTHLHLLKNRISKIESGAFKGLNNLQYINLKDNIISDIEAGAFDDLNNLRSLDLSNNSLESLGPEVLDDLQRPFKLNLRDNTFQCNRSMICPLRKEDDDETIEFTGYPVCPNKRFHYSTKDCDVSRPNEIRGLSLLGLLTAFVGVILV